MTVRAIAVADGSADLGSAQPVGVNTRARVKRSVTERDRVREPHGQRIRRYGRVMYLDAKDSWIVRESSPAPLTVWRADYSTTVPGQYAPFVAWCNVWRVPAVVFGTTLDAAKFLLIHPVRGPLTLSTAAALVAIATH